MKPSTSAPAFVIKGNTMKVDIDNLIHFHNIGRLMTGTFGDAKETACLMSALTGKTNFKGCEAEGWPLWLAKLGAWFFDTAPDDERYEQGLQFAVAVKAAANADFDAVFREIRLDSILPIALDAVGSGNEDWRIACREAVQWSIDNEGIRNPDATWAVEAAEAVEGVGGIGTVEAVEAAAAVEGVGGIGAVEAAEAAWATGDDWAAARLHMFNSTIKVLRQHATLNSEDQL